MILWQFLALLAVHWFADFVCQTDWQATNKSSDDRALAAHVGCYALILLIAATVLLPTIAHALSFTVVNASFHCLTDYFTSRWSSWLYAKKDRHNFFVVVGFDQLIHQATLAVTLWFAVS